MHNNQTRFLPKGRVDCFEAAVKTIASDFAPIRRDKQIMVEVGCNCRNDPRDAKSPRPIPCIVVPMPSRLHRESDEEAELGTILDKRSDASASMLGASVRGVRRNRIWRQTTPEQQASEVQRHQQLD